MGKVMAEAGRQARSWKAWKIFVGSSDLILRVTDTLGGLGEGSEVWSDSVIVEDRFSCCVEMVCRCVREEVGRPLGRCCKSPGEARPWWCLDQSDCTGAGESRGLSVYFERSQQTCWWFRHSNRNIKAD